MAYIPEKHKKYDVLPMCRKRGGEVFSYPGKIIDDLENYLPEEENMIPYGYDSYEQYMKKWTVLHCNIFKRRKLKMFMNSLKI